MIEDQLYMGVFGILFIVFLVLKLTNLIAWSWLAVTAPLWIFGLITLFAILATVIYSLMTRD